MFFASSIHVAHADRYVERHIYPVGQAGKWMQGPKIYPVEQAGKWAQVPTPSRLQSKSETESEDSGDTSVKAKDRMGNATGILPDRSGTEEPQMLQEINRHPHFSYKH